MSEPSPSDGGNNQAGKLAPERRLFFRSFGYFVLGMILFYFFMAALGPINNKIRTSEVSMGLQTAHVIALTMFQYANDNNQNYPDGKSSTEVFQKLIDGGYITVPSIFYVPLAGKIKPDAGQRLKPENVCWDVTSPVDSSAPDGLPLVFLTGYKVDYVPGGAAVPLIKPYPVYGRERTWSEWWQGEPERKPFTGIAVCYKSNSAKFIDPNASTSVNPDGSIPNFVPTDFDAKGKTYRQLTPDGVLSDK